MALITLKNDFLTVEIASLGAEIQSVKSSKGTEFIWEGDPKFWDKHAPILFPICGRLKNHEYTYGGKTYHLTGHGFAQRKEFFVKSATETSAIFVLTPDDETKECYPFDFEFEARFTLEGKALTVTYNTLNCSETEPMYFSCGGHEAYACPEGIEEYTVSFEKEVDLTTRARYGEILEASAILFMQNVKEVKLREEFFMADALTFEHLGVNKIQLSHNHSAKKITVDFPCHDYLFLWNKFRAPYLCIEPWAGFPDTPESDGDFTTKVGINKLEAKEQKAFTHIITFED